MDSLAILPHEDKRRDTALDTPLGEDPDSKLGSKEDIGHAKVDAAGAEGWTVPEEWIARFVDEYSGEHGGQSETLPPGSDPELTARAVMTMHEDEARKMLVERVNATDYDYNFDTVLFARLKQLIQGPEACGYEYGDWAYITSKTAGFLHNWSPYAEVRAVTIPYDDPEEPCESFRAYFLGFFWVIVVTAVNTFFSPRQPGISIPGSVVQLLLVPMGRGLAAILPDWGFTRKGVRYTINPGPWSPKEQLLATIIFMGNSTIGNFTGLLVMRLPIFFGQRWATFGFCLVLAIANQGYGMGLAGILRRLAVYPTEAVWPSALPTLALNRTLVATDNKRETINGWKISRYTAFVLSGVVFLVYYWIPNQFFVALRLFSWMSWIAPSNKALAIVTGSYGGMGFNPLSSWDPVTSGRDAMNSPFFAQLQQYVMRAISGLIIIILYYCNVSWAAFMPINSNGTFDNTFQAYNVSRVLNDQNTVDVDSYLEYGPPYYAIANLYVTGANFVYYTFSVLYVFIKFWKPLKKAFYGLVVNMMKGRSTFHGFDDGNTRLMKRYKDVPEWWYGIIFGLGFIISVIACEAWPTQTPWWSIIGVTVIGTVLTIPWVIIESIANTGIQLNVIWQLLPGLWFPGKPMPQLVIVMLGGAFEQMAVMQFLASGLFDMFHGADRTLMSTGNFTNDLKYAHYARLPPRAVFRGHVIATIVNCFTYCVMLEVMMIYFNNDSTLCRWDNTAYMVCQYANSVFSSTIFFGAFGTNNMFKLYPILPYCFLFGAILAVVWLGGEIYFPKLRQRLSLKMDPKSFATLDKRIWGPMSSLFSCLNPAIALSGALAWAGNNNLSYATLGIYIAWFFQYYLKRRYTAWWGKYAYLLFAGLSVGVAISGLIVTLVFSFGAGQGVSFNWWGNTVQRQGFDWDMYNQVGALRDLPEKGYFGIDPEDYPTRW